MNITIFIGGLSGGGAERVVCNLSNFLSKKHNITILTLSDDEPITKLNKRVKRISLMKKNEKNNFIIRNFKRLIRFRNYINKSKADVYLVMLPVTINLMLMHRKKIKSPIIVSERADPNTRYTSSKLKKWLMLKLYPKADGFVFQTEDAMNYYNGIIGDSKIVIPNAINNEFIKEPYNGLRRKTIISVGRFTEQKNFQMLIEAFSRITKKHPDYNMVIYGEGPLRAEMEKQVSELGLKHKVTLPGYVENIANHIVDVSLFVLTSNYEGMPNALMEAMALGIPCISTDCPIGGPRYLINDNKNGFLIPTNDVNKLVETIDKVLSNKKLSLEISRKSRNISSTLNSEEVYNQWDTYISKVVNIK